MKLPVSTFIFAIGALGLVSSVVADEPNLADSLSYSKWSGELVVPDPISISFDDQGRAYVTQTQRRKAQDLDIRNNRDWIPNDVGLSSVEEKRAFFRSRISIETKELNASRVADHNGDGVHDYRDLMVLSERIYRVEDSDGDGLADRMDLFAEDFKTEVTGIAAGVLWHDDTIYATVAPDVWKLWDEDGDGKADKREVLSTGYGLHIAYGGHDMHGLTVGPDGKIYWSIGDKGINAVSQEGERFFYPNQGGVMRCNPDGSDFEVYAHGLRNVQEFAFDEYGNWFGIDNDSDQTGESERFVYIVRGMDAGWRCNFQYRGDGYNPWTAENLWIPHHEGQPAYIVPAISNYVDGPAGFVYNPGTALNPGYKDYFFVNSTMNGSQWAFRTEPKGASFEMVDSHQIGAGVPLIGMTVAPDGALYSVDWGGGYPLNQRGAIWKIDDASGADRTVRESVASMIAEGTDSIALAELRRRLGHVDQRIRLAAQFELVDRMETNALIAESRSGDLIKRIHAIWGLGQLARNESKAAIDRLVSLLADSESEIQVQSAKMLADLKRGAFDGSVLRPLLRSDNARVLFQAGLAIGRHGVTEAFDDVVSMIEANDGKDLYLRHSGVMALKGMGNAESLQGHSSDEVLLSAVVALRKASNPEVARFLEDESTYVAREAALAIHDDVSIVSALPQLADAVERIDFTDAALAYRSMNANLRLGSVTHAKRIARLATRTDIDGAYRVEALEALGEWPNPNVLDRVDGRYRKLEARSKRAIAEAVGPALAGLLGDEDSLVVERVVSVSNRLGVGLDSKALASLLENEGAPAPLRVTALESLNTDEGIDYGLKSSSALLRAKAASLLIAKDPQRATVALVDSLTTSESIPEKQSALASLAAIGLQDSDQAIEAWASRLERGEVEPALQLDVIEAAKKRGFDTSVAAFEASRDATSSIGPFIEALHGGDAIEGERIANTHLAAQCVRCHRFSSAPGSKIGPNLKAVGSKQNREYLLRALVDPQADILPAFSVVTVTLKDGSTVSGIAGKEDETTMGVLSVDRDSVKRIPKTDIESITDPISTMPPMAYVLTKRELRDVVAYLASLKE